jgi:DNA-binding HxlR family transcriptional regulator
VDGYAQFCPIALGAEIFAQRWTPLILRELLGGSHRFSELQRGLPRMSKNLLVQRLTFLEEAGIIERRRRTGSRGFDYYPTVAGEELRPVVNALGAWGYSWAARDLRAESLDAGLLMWFLRRRVRVDSLPDEKVVVSFQFRGQGPRPAWLDEDQRFWLVLDKPNVELCLTDPGFDVGLDIEADLGEMTRVYLGQLSLSEAVGSGAVELTGRRDLRRGLGNWLGISPFAPARPKAPRRVAAV